MNKEHLYATKVSARTAANSQGCPICFQGHRVSLIDYPAAAEQFLCTSDNSGFIPTNLPASFKVFWRCTGVDQHVTYESFDKLKGRDFQCEKCFPLPRKGFDSSLTLADFPELLAQLHPVQEKPFDPKTTSASSFKSVRWICSAKHVWVERIDNRTINKLGCPFCKDSRKQGASPSAVQCQGPICAVDGTGWIRKAK